MEETIIAKEPERGIEVYGATGTKKLRIMHRGNDQWDITLGKEEFRVHTTDLLALALLIEDRRPYVAHLPNIRGAL
jgi:hypothetical protein